MRWFQRDRQSAQYGGDVPNGYEGVPPTASDVEYLQQTVSNLQQEMADLRAIVQANADTITATGQTLQTVHDEIRKRVLITDIASMGREVQAHGEAIEVLQEKVLTPSEPAPAAPDVPAKKRATRKSEAK